MRLIDQKLFNAAELLGAQECENLLKRGANLHARDLKGSTALHIAVRVEVAQLLLGLGLDPNARNDTGQTPLHAAAFKGAVGVAEVLLKHGCDLQATTHSNLTPLQIASARMFNRCALLLIAHGAEATQGPAKFRGLSAEEAAVEGNFPDRLLSLLTPHSDAPSLVARAAARAELADVLMILRAHKASQSIARLRPVDQNQRRKEP